MTLNEKLKLLLNQVTEPTLVYRAVTWVNEIEAELNKVAELQEKYNALQETNQQLRSELDNLMLEKEDPTPAISESPKPRATRTRKT